MGIKITKNLLNKYKDYKKEIPMLEAKLHELKTTDAGKGNSTIFNYTTGYPKPESVIGFDHEKYEKKRSLLEKRKNQVEAVERWIDEIEDIQTQMVFEKRYIQGKSWLTIAKEIGCGGNVDYPRVCIRDKYLKEKKIH